MSNSAWIVPSQIEWSWEDRRDEGLGNDQHESEAEAAASPGDPSVGQVVISFDAAGTAAMTEVSGRISNHSPPLNQFACLVDGRVQSAPYFQEQIRAGRAVMTTASMAEAQRVSGGIQL